MNFKDAISQMFMSSN